MNLLAGQPAHQIENLNFRSGLHCGKQPQVGEVIRTLNIKVKHYFVQLTGVVTQRVVVASGHLPEMPELGIRLPVGKSATVSTWPQLANIVHVSRFSKIGNS